MKKRLLSTFLALAMVFSMVPTTLAYDLISSDTPIKEVQFIFNDDGSVDLSSIKIAHALDIEGDFGAAVNTPFDFAITIVPTSGKIDYYDPDDSAQDMDFSSSFGAGEETIGTAEDVTAAVDTPYIRITGSSTATGNLEAVTAFNYSEYKLSAVALANYLITNELVEPDEELGQTLGDFYFKVYGDEKKYPLDGSEGWPFVPVTVYAVSSLKDGANSPLVSLLYLGETDTTVSLTATLTAPALKNAPATTVTGVTVDGAAATASAVTWSANATAANGYPAAGTGTYTATFDITAPNGVTFTEGQTFSISIDGATSARAVYKDASTATVTAVFPAIAKTAASITATAPTTSVEVGDSYDVKYAPITITYNDGTTLAVDASSASYASSGITVDTSALTGGEKGKTSLIIAGADKGKTLNVTALLGALSTVIEKVKVTEYTPPVGGSEVYAVYENGTLTFKYNDPAEETGTVYKNILNINQASATDLPWNANRSSITKVVFDRSFGYAFPTDTSYWFANCANLTEIEGIGHLITKDTTNMSNMFAGCEKLTAPDLSALDTSKVTDMSGMFKDCKALTSLDVSSLDTSKVTDMSQMLEGCTGITELDISEWDTTALTNTTEMFKDCTALKTIYADEAADWTANTITGTDMFDGCIALAGGNGTIYSNDHKDNARAIADGKGKQGYFTATRMVSGTYAVYDGDKTFTFKYSKTLVRERGTIYDAENTTNATGTNGKEPWLDISGKVENVIFEDSFAEARPKCTMWWFNGFTNLTSIEGIENLNTSAVTDMGYMFRDCAKLENLDVTHLDTSKVTNMDEMFAGCTKLKALNVSGFDTSNATTIHKMFLNCSELTSLDVSDFNTAKVTGMTHMFENCRGIKELNIANWDVSKVTNANGIFSGCSNLERIIASTDTDWSGINNGDNMFKDCTSLRGGAGTAYAAANIGKTYAVTDGYNNKKGYFTGTSAGQGAYAVYDGDNTLTFKYSEKEVREFGTVYPVENTPSDDPDKIPWKNYKGNITTVEFDSSFSAARPKSTANWFNGMVNLTKLRDIRNLNTSDTTNMSGMFVNYKKAATVDLSTFNTAKVTDMSRMFEGCSGFTDLDLSKFNTSNVTNMSQMFSGCSALTSLDVTKFNTSKVTDMSAMFNDCSTLTTLDVSKLDTSKVTNMTNMFKNCSKLETIDAGEVKDWKTNAVSQSTDMFKGCTQLKGVYEYNSEHTDVNMANTTKGYFKPLPPSPPTVSGIDGEMTGVYGEGTTITVDATAPAGHSLLYQWYSNATESNEGGTAITGATDASYEIGGTVPVGTHYYYCVVTAKRDDNGLTDTATSDAAAVTITKATPDVTAPDDITATYGQTLADVTLTEGWAWDDTTTGVGTAGEHTFSATYTPSDTDNYNTVTKDVTVTVGKATPTATAPTGITAKYGQTLADVELPEHWEWKNSTAGVGNVGTNEFTAVYTPVDTDNYTTAEMNVTVAVSKADQAAPASPTADEKTYSSITLEPITGGVNGVEYAISATEEEPDEDAWTDSATFTGLNTDTTYYIYARYKGDDSHNVSPSSHAAIKTNEHVHDWEYTANGTTITATCKNTDHSCPNTVGGTIIIAAPANTEFDDKPHEAIVTNNLTTGADVQVKYEYKSWGADKFAEINDLPINSGMYTASITLGDATISVSYSITVTQQTPEPTPTDSPSGEKLYTVGGGTVASGMPVVPVTGVKLRIDSLDKEVVSGTYGLFQFDDLPEGKYTLTITYTDSNGVERTKDQIFEVTGNDLNRAIVVPDKNVSSSVDIDESLDDVYVDKLDDVAEDLAKDEADDADVKIKLSVEPEDEDETNEVQNEIRKLAGDESDHMDYIDIKVTKTVGEGDAEVVEESDKSVRILIPYDSEKQYSVKVYRYDTNSSDEAKAVSLSTNKKDSEYYEITDDGYIAIVTNKFTTYAIGYDDEPEPTPTPIVIRRGGGGGGGSSSTKATPTPVPTESPEPTETPEPAPTETPAPTSRPSGDDGWWFIDVPKIEWFYPPIYYAYYNDLMYGTSEETFEPYLDITRAMFVTVLYRIDGSPEAPLDYTFEDIDKDSYYEQAVAWGSANDIIAGYSAEEYAPYDTITREQMAAILWRYAKYKGTDVSVGDETSIDDFIDADETTEYAIPALKWAYGDRILSGFEDNTLRPLSFATRAQASVVLGEYNKKIKE